MAFLCLFILNRMCINYSAFIEQYNSLIILCVCVCILQLGNILFCFIGRSLLRMNDSTLERMGIKEKAHRYRKFD